MKVPSSITIEEKPVSESIVQVAYRIRAFSEKSARTKALLLEGAKQFSAPLLKRGVPIDIDVHEEK